MFSSRLINAARVSTRVGRVARMHTTRQAKEVVPPNFGPREEAALDTIIPTGMFFTALLGGFVMPGIVGKEWDTDLPDAEEAHH